MYVLCEYIGEDSFNVVLCQYVDVVVYQEVFYIILLECIEFIKVVILDSLEYLIEDMFEMIMFYSNCIIDVIYKELLDGCYEVSFEVEVVKFRVDLVGCELFIEFNDWIEIGVLVEVEEGK